MRDFLEETLDLSTSHSSSAARALRLGAVLLSGALLLGLLIAFRVAKAATLGLTLGPLDWSALMLPEIGAVLLLEAIMLAFSGVRSRLAGAAWWAIFCLAHAVAYAAAVIEQSFYLQTGTRLNLALIRYAFDNLEMLRGLILSSADRAFAGQLQVATLLLFAGIVGGVALGKRLRSFALRPLVLSQAAVGLLCLAAPATLPIATADLGPSTFGELLHRPGVGKAAIAAALPRVVPPAELYQAPAVVAHQPGGPNIVLILLESTRFDVMAPWAPADRAAQLPNTTRLAAESLAFDSVYTSVSHTSKALVGILCGMFPRLEVPIWETLEHNLPLACLPHLLQQAGYRTAFFQSATARFENRPGLLRNLGFENAGFLETIIRPGFGITGYLGIDEAAMIEPARDFVERAGDAPFLLTLLSVSPHHPYQVPGQPRPEQTGELFPAYFETIRHQDAFIGQVFAMLAEKGLLESTVVVLHGDHGEAFGEHRRRQHDKVPYEEVVRVPLLMHAPWLFGPPRRVGGLRHQTDLFPTLLGLARVEVSGKFPGRDLLATNGHEWVWSSCWLENLCVSGREGDRKIVYHFGMRPTEIFDLARDPGETTNLAPGLAPDEVAREEARLLAAKLSVDGFWREHPARPGPLGWWQH